jgi:hypothetical protein
MNLVILAGLLAWSDPAVAHGTEPSHLSNADWPAIRAEREAEIHQYLGDVASGYAWFADAMHGEPAGTPYLLMRTLPELAPDIWGPTEERLARFGFFDDPEDPDRPFPLGLGWMLDPVHDGGEAREYHSVTLTCAACHVGRVRIAPGQFRVLVGAPNTQIDVRKFRRAIELTTDRLLASPAAIQETVTRLIELIKSRPEGYFFGGRFGIDAQAEADERMRFQDPSNLARILAGFAGRVQGGRAAVEKQLQTSYSRLNAPPLDGGSPGQSDGSGDLIPKFLLGREILSQAAGDGDPIGRFLATYYPEMPYRNATVTDNLSVWRQADRPFGQLDGSIRAPIIRNVAAQTAVVGSSRGINVRNADICAKFTANLPAPPYPFAVDMVRARRGEALFLDHCAVCHRAGNGAAYPADRLGTDSNRARVLSVEGKALLIENFRAAIPKDYEATAADGTTYKPADLTPDEIVNDRARPDHQGYVAGPLDGLWARAPYLHNGSVPTLRHLLAPRNPESQRPQAFVRGVVDYDPLHIGFAWDPKAVGAGIADAPTAIIFDTGWDGASNLGHDHDLHVNDDGQLDPRGRLRRLDWSGAELRNDLEDLLEYLKTR